jgi:hypothetical protein
MHAAKACGVAKRADLIEAPPVKETEGASSAC